MKSFESRRGDRRSFLVADQRLARAASRADAAPIGVLGLTANASVEVTKDLLAVTFSTTREGSDANAVQAQLKQALDAALAEARKAARPGQVDVQTGNFSLYPRYSNGSSSARPAITGWQGAPSWSSKVATWPRSASSPAASRR